MSSITFALVSLIFSGVFLHRLVQTNPKRRRTHKLSAIPQNNQHTKVLWILVICPALVLLFGKLFSAFIMWLAGLFLIGWAMAAIKPKKKLTK